MTEGLTALDVEELNSAVSKVVPVEPEAMETSMEYTPPKESYSTNKSNQCLRSKNDTEHVKTSEAPIIIPYELARELALSNKLPKEVAKELLGDDSDYPSRENERNYDAMSYHGTIQNELTVTTSALHNDKEHTELPNDLDVPQMPGRPPPVIVPPHILSETAKRLLPPPGRFVPILPKTTKSKDDAILPHPHPPAYKYLSSRDTSDCAKDDMRPILPPFPHYIPLMTSLPSTSSQYSNTYSRDAPPPPGYLPYSGYIREDRDVLSEGVEVRSSSPTSYPAMPPFIPYPLSQNESNGERTSPIPFSSIIPALPSSLSSYVPPPTADYTCTSNTTHHTSKYSLPSFHTFSLPPPMLPPDSMATHGYFSTINETYAPNQEADKRYDQESEVHDVSYNQEQAVTVEEHYNADQQQSISTLAEREDKTFQKDVPTPSDVDVESRDGRTPLPKDLVLEHMSAESSSIPGGMLSPTPSQIDAAVSSPTPSQLRSESPALSEVAAVDEEGATDLEDRERAHSVATMVVQPRSVAPPQSVEAPDSVEIIVTEEVPECDATYSGTTHHDVALNYDTAVGCLSTVSIASVLSPVARLSKVSLASSITNESYSIATSDGLPTYSAAQSSDIILPPITSAYSRPAPAAAMVVTSAMCLAPAPSMLAPTNLGSCVIVSTDREAVLPIVSTGADQLTSQDSNVRSEHTTALNVLDLLLRGQGRIETMEEVQQITEQAVTLAEVVRHDAAVQVISKDGQYCVDCNAMVSSGGCTKHDTNYLHVIDKPILSRARATLPNCFQLFLSEGVTSIKACSALTRRTLFGPMEGSTITTDQLLKLGHRSAVPTLGYWSIFRDGRQAAVLDCTDENKSNWTMFLRQSYCSDKVNLKAFQKNELLYFVTNRDVAAGEELLYWFGRDYAVMLNAAASPEDRFRCAKCKKQFGDDQALQRHIRFQHPDTTKRRFVCSICRKLFTHAHKLKLHLLSHLCVKPHKCAECGRQFTDPSNLRQHMLIHKGEKRYRCSQCDVTFRQRAHLTSHMAGHGPTKAFTCSHCGKGFNRKYDLNNHVNILHTKQNAFVCHKPECGKVFYKHQTFQRHLKVHEGNYTNTCDKCNMSFLEAYKLRRHQKTCVGPRSSAQRRVAKTPSKKKLAAKPAKSNSE